MRSGAPRRRPYPYDLVLNGTGVMLGYANEKDAKNGAPLVAVKPSDMSNTVPTAYDYSAQNPVVEKVQAYSDLGLGFGLKMQASPEDKRYRYALNVDCSCGLPWLKGPQLNSVTPDTVDTASGITQFFEMDNSLYALNGRYCLVRTNDSTWSVSKDFGEGKVAQDAVVFHSNAEGAVECAYIAMGDTEAIWRFDGTNWEQRVEVQTVTITGGPTGGTFTLGYGAESTGNLSYDITAADMQTALRALTGLGAVTVDKDGVVPGTVVYTVTFERVGDNAELLTHTNGLTGGTTPTIQHAVTQETIKALAWAMVGRELYRANDVNYVAKVDTNAEVWEEANWSAANAFRVGDHKEPVRKMTVTADGVLLIFKDDGVYTLNQYGEDQRFFPYLDMAARGGTYASLEAKGSYGALEAFTYQELEQGVRFEIALGCWLNDIYISYAAGAFRLRPDYSLEQIGPERMTTNDSEVRGVVTAYAGHETLHLYAGLYNPDTGSSYLLKYGSWLGGASSEGIAQRVESWHGSITPAFESKRITTLKQSSIGAAGNHMRMYIGFSDGTVCYFALPCSPNPATCSEYRFSLEPGYLYLPIATMMFASDVKLLHAYAVSGMLDPESYVNIEYRDDMGANWYGIAEAFNTTPREKVLFPLNVTATYLEQRLVFSNTYPTSSPEATGMGLFFSVRANILPELYKVYQFRVLAEDRLLKRNGTPFRLGADYIKSVVEGAAGTPNTVTAILPDETSCQLKVIGYGETMAWDERLRQWYGALQVEAVRQAKNEVYGTYGRLEAYTYGYLEMFTFAQLARL